MRIVGLPGLSFGGVSRTDGWSALGRSEYQMGIERRDSVAHAKRRGGHVVEHVRQWLLLPEGVDPDVWSCEAVWRAAQEVEKRKDAREGRFFDISWPRELPTDHVEGFIESLYRHFVGLGLAVQVDWETSPADDGQPNDHIHGLISTRILTNLGFSAEKCRELDGWFRGGVRQRVADLFNAIAGRHQISVRFDPRPNVIREDALPPEGYLPRRMIRNPALLGAEKGLARREEERKTRNDHRELIAEIENLELQAKGLRAEIEAQLEDMTTLSSLQAEGRQVNPLPLEVAMSALIAAGIDVADRVASVDVGLLLVVDKTSFVDTGDRIHIDGLLQGEAVRGMYVLARRKGWRELSMTDPWGMPEPVPPMPPARKEREKIVSTRQDFERFGKSGVTAAVHQVVKDLGSSGEGRRDVLERVARWDNPRLQRMIAHLVALVDEKPSAEIGADTVQNHIDMVMNDDHSLWRRYCLEADLEAMCVPGHALSRPFKPHPQFHEVYNVPVPKTRHDVLLPHEGAGQ